MEEAFSNRVVWYQDVDINSEIKRMAQGVATPAARQETPIAAKTAEKNADAAPPVRRQPVAITLPVAQEKQA